MVNPYQKTFQHPFSVDFGPSLCGLVAGAFMMAHANEQQNVDTILHSATAYAMFGSAILHALMQLDARFTLAYACCVACGAVSFLCAAPLIKTWAESHDIMGHVLLFSALVAALAFFLLCTIVLFMVHGGGMVPYGASVPPPSFLSPAALRPSYTYTTSAVGTDSLHTGNGRLHPNGSGHGLDAALHMNGLNGLNNPNGLNGRSLQSTAVADDANI